MRILLDPSSGGGGGSSTGGLIGGGVAGIIGAPFNILGSLDEQNAMNKAISNELARQQAYQKYGQGVFDEHLNQNSLLNVNKDIQGGTKQAADNYNMAPGVATAGHAGLPTLGSSFLSPLTTGANNASNQNAAGAQGYTDWGVKQALQNLKARSKIGQNNMFSQQSEQVLPLELNSASQSQEGLKSFGSLLGDVGGIAAMAAL